MLFESNAVSCVPLGDDAALFQGVISALFGSPQYPEAPWTFKRRDPAILTAVVATDIFSQMKACA